MLKSFLGGKPIAAVLRALLVLLFAGSSGCSAIGSDVTSHDEVDHVRVAPDSVTVKVGESVKITVTAYNDQDTVLTSNVGSPFWQSINSDIARVSDSGVIVGLSVGRTLVQASIKNKAASVTVIVTSVPPASAGMIAYTAGGGFTSIAGIQTDGSNAISLVTSAVPTSGPAWSRNGSLLAFASNNSGVYSISYIAVASPAAIVPVVIDSTKPLSGPTWSPDGSQLAFVRDVSAGHSQIFVVNKDGSNPRNISNSTFNDIQPAWSPDGTKILFASDRNAKYGPGQYLEVYTMKTDGSQVTRLTNNDDGVDYYPAWSPDGTQIAFTSVRATNPTNYFQALDIWIMNADGSNLRNLTNSGYGDASPSWSPDGKQIAFITDRGRPSNPYAWEIWIIDVDGSNPRPVTHGGSETGPAWKP